MNQDLLKLKELYGIRINREQELTGDWRIRVYHKDKLMFDWYEEYNVSYPEDLTWEREISDVFYEGIRLGYEIRKSEEETDERNRPDIS
jgi:hypothetical protein